MSKPLLSVKEVASHLGVTPITVYRMVKNSRIPFVRVEGQLRFPPDDIDAWLAAKKKAAVL